MLESKNHAWNSIGIGLRWTVPVTIFGQPKRLVLHSDLIVFGFRNPGITRAIQRGQQQRRIDKRLGVLTASTRCNTSRQQGSRVPCERSEQGNVRGARRVFWASAARPKDAPCAADVALKILSHRQPCTTREPATARNLPLRG